jgi:hypothetical protein
MANSVSYKYSFLLFFAILLLAKSQQTFAQATHSNDTLLVAAVIYNGDTIPAKTLENVTLLTKYSSAQASARAAWTRLRNAIYVTYPYAKRASVVINDINVHLANVSSSSERRKYIKTREKELKKEFTEPLTNLSIYQGKILMKLINRETGNNCYEIIKEYKGGLTARFYQTVAFFFDGDLKQPYDAHGDDAEMEKIVLEVQRMYGYKS